MTDLSALADEIERLDGPSRHADTQIAILLDPDAQHIIGYESGPFPRKPIYGPRSSFWDWARDTSIEPPVFMAVPEYTASLDAAMTLVPEGFDWAVFRTNGGLTVHAWCGYRDDVFAATPALALCAAAIRARSENHHG